MPAWLRRLFRRRSTDWDWGLPGGPKTLRAHEENISLFQPKVTYPSGFESSSFAAPATIQYEPPEPSKDGRVLAEEPATLSTMQGTILPVDTRATVEAIVPGQPNGEAEGRVVLGFENGKMILDDGNPLVKEFVRAADRMMRPRRRIFGKVGA